MHLAERDEAVKVLPDLFDRSRRSRAGEVNRDSQRWDSILTDRARDRGAGLASFSALAEQGYVRYRAHHADIGRAERARVVVEELRGLTPDDEAALWRFVLDIDLVGEVTFKRRPVDEPLRWRLRDSRQLRTVSIDDELYVRVLDVPAAFGARASAARGDSSSRCFLRKWTRVRRTPRPVGGCSSAVPKARRAGRPARGRTLT